MLAKERKPQAHSPSPRSIKHCNQPVLSQRRAQNEYSSRNERKKPNLLPAISPKRKAKAKSGARKKERKQKPHLPTQRFRPKGEERRASQRKNPVLSFKAKSGEAEHGEKKRRLFERSEFLRFRRAKPRSRLETADGGFSFCYLFLFAAKKKK